VETERDAAAAMAQWLKQTMALRGRPPPDFIYRFLSSSSEFGPANIENLLRRDSVHLSSRSQFNDVFDCRFHHVLSDDPAAWKAYQEDVLMRKGRMTRLQARKSITASGQTVVSVKRSIQKSVQREVDRMGVCSFSENIQSATQWAHYGDLHRGVAVELRFAPFSVSFPAMPVRYQSEITKLRSPSESIANVFRAAVTKNKDWEYEQEWRIVDPSRAGRSFKLPPNSVSRVILGMNAPRSVEDTIRGHLEWRMARRMSTFDIARARRPEDRYGLEF
jgi:hypothetical protein